MGAAQSNEPRSVSMDNPHPAGVIDVSDEVVQRLKRNITKQAKENASAATATAAAVSTPTPKEEKRAIPVSKPQPAPPKQPTVVYQNVPAAYAGPGGVTITALEMRRQKELELQQNDGMWKQRMAELERTLNKTNAVMEKEYTAAVEDVRKRFATAAPTHQLPPCQDLKAQVIACYRAHPGETLKCSEEVAMFQNCVTANRIHKLDADEEDSPPSAVIAKPIKAG